MSKGIGQVEMERSWPSAELGRRKFIYLLLLFQPCLLILGWKYESVGCVAPKRYICFTSSRVNSEMWKLIYLLLLHNAALLEEKNTA